MTYIQTIAVVLAVIVRESCQKLLANIFRGPYKSFSTKTDRVGILRRNDT